MRVLDVTAKQPHARAVLRRAVPPDPRPSHAYLFQGPRGSGKRRTARALAAELLADGAQDPASVLQRVERDAHPDLTWVVPTGAGEMRVADVDETVVQAVTARPFEATRRVFVLEHADAMNDAAANRLLKTLEEPPDYACLVLLTDRPGELLPTVRSRCQTVRFDAATEDEQVQALEGRGVARDVALACVRLALGDAEHAAWLAFGDGATLRSAAESFARHALASGAGPTGAAPTAALTTAATARAKAAAREVEDRAAARAEELPDRDRRRVEREGKDDAKRAERRARTAALDDGLGLVGLWLRDVAAVALGAPDRVHAVDRIVALDEDASRTGDVHALLAGVDEVDRTRRALRVNAGVDLQLDALAVRLGRLAGGAR